ncbi:SDR family oxidoreductase [Allosphingosinicella deserti]|uniref:Short-chain dehydrogenase n=1 Tax=Allosphingosinicella deserti TaxID=2116704 RepID=A0A2P7QQW8_9SPHN|nr:SDR family oxidoreductase [Sphingomonas deserti]PSJ40352.1 short-chain dehydrogenase [Sphingomonas deserti]
MSFEDKVVVITGGAGGFGAALANRFRQEGGRVYVGDIVKPPEGDGNGDRFMRMDVGREHDIRSLVDWVVGAEGRIDTFVSNAGITIPMDAHAAEHDWDRIVAVNQMSHVRVARHLVPIMSARGGGQLIITASASSFQSELMSIGYAATKYAAFAIAEWLAFTYRGAGLRVSALCPGPVRTPLLDGVPYLHPLAISPEQAANVAFPLIAEGRFFIPTHPFTGDQWQQKAQDLDGYVDQLVALKAQLSPAASLPLPT